MDTTETGGPANWYHGEIFLLELHIDGVAVTVPELGTVEDDGAGVGQSGGRLGTAVLAVGTFAVIAVVATKRLGDSEEVRSIDTHE